MPFNQQEPAQRGWENRLCPECGLCCNGALFKDVRLTQSDRHLVLKQQGLKLVKIGGKLGFRQPCQCFDGNLCRIYQFRPAHCRDFECHTLKQLQKGVIRKSTALRRVRSAKLRMRELESLLRRLGCHHAHLSLVARYKKVMQQPIDLTQDDGLVETHAELMTKMNDLMAQLHSDFLAPDEIPQ